LLNWSPLFPGQAPQFVSNAAKTESAENIPAFPVFVSMNQPGMAASNSSMRGAAKRSIGSGAEQLRTPPVVFVPPAALLPSICLFR